MQLRVTVFAALLASLVGPALAAAAGLGPGAEIAGPARVVDGDTLTVGGVRIRLSGIDAPETDQVCLDSTARAWTCGVAAREALAQAIGTGAVRCVATGQDVYGRTLADCVAAGQDVERWMVQRGYALSFQRYSHRYDAEEEEARRGRRGLWAGAFVAPWDWRARNPRTVVLGAVSVPLSARAQLLEPGSARDAPAKDCVIKGNVSRGGERIYHLPGQSHYAEVNMATGSGKRWFCSEDEAEAAGWRKALR